MYMNAHKETQSDNAPSLHSAALGGALMSPLVRWGVTAGVRYAG